MVAWVDQPLRRGRRARWAARREVLVAERVDRAREDYLYAKWRRSEAALALGLGALRQAAA